LSQEEGGARRLAWAISLARAPRTRDQSKYQIKGGARCMRAVGDRPSHASRWLQREKCEREGRRLASLCARGTRALRRTSFDARSWNSASRLAESGGRRLRSV